LRCGSCHCRPCGSTAKRQNCGNRKYRSSTVESKTSLYTAIARACSIIIQNTIQDNFRAAAQLRLNLSTTLGRTMNDITQHNFLEIGTVRHLRDDQEALKVAKEVAAQLKTYAEDTAYNKTLPYAQAKLISESGLTSISVPKAHGGLGASILTIVNVVKIISAADAGVGQLLQIHFTMFRGISTSYSDEIRDRLLADILAGKRLGNA